MATVEVRVYEDVTVGGGLDLAQGVHNVNLVNLSAYEAPIENGQMGFALNTNQTELLSREVNNELYKVWVNSYNSAPLTTKGDLLGFSTANVRVPVGANDTVLIADSAQARGLRWGSLVASQIPSLDASKITSGIFGHARLGTGGGGSTKFLREDGTYQTISISPAGSNQQIQYNNSGAFGASSNLTFDGSNLNVTGALKVLNGTKHAEYSVDASYNAIFGHAYAASDNVLQYQFKYYSTGGYGTRGIALMDVGNGYTTLLNQTASGSLYITDGAGTAGTLTLGTRTNPSDGTTFVAQSGFWWINTGVFSVGTSSLQGNGQIESFSTSKSQFIAYYNSSNYAKITVGLNGATEFDAVGSSAKFTFKDNVVARLEKRVNSQTNVSTLTPNANDYDMERLTAQTSALTIANPSGTPTEGQELTIKIVASSNNSISYSGNYGASSAIALPSALISGSTMLMQFHYDSILDTWLITNYQEY